jgi:UDP-glucuronate 4-epimerase
VVDPRPVSAASPVRRALVTGGAGFVGSTLVDRLLSNGWAVTALDSFDEAYPRDVKMANLRGALDSEHFALVEADTRSASELSREFSAAQPEVVFDLAARAGVRPSIADPAGYVATNVAGLQNTLSAAAAVEARVVFASSSSIYGNDDRRPFREDQANGRPESPYGATKIAGEALAHAHHRATGLPVGVARLFTVYGPRQRPDLAIHRFARRILAGEPVELFDDGRGLRDYTYVDDAVDALVRMADVAEPWVILNIGSDRPVVTADVVAEIERALGVLARRVSMPAQPGDVAATHADIGRARDLLGWAPRMPFREGIERFCAWLRGSASPAAG